MNEEHKLSEARYFYDRMLSETDNREAFRNDLSAFISAARSVLQYAREEAKTKLNGLSWYDAQVSTSSVLSFFKDQRDINIHVQPFQVSQHTSMEITDTIHMTESIHIKMFNEKGELIGESSSEPAPAAQRPAIPAVVTNKFTFSDWTGSEDVPQLCKAYLNELRRIVTDGQNKGFLTK
jgi:hypothetical protein